VADVSRQAVKKIYLMLVN